MSYPVTDFTNLDLWYIYNGILESGGGGGGGMSQEQFFAVMNGDYPFGNPASSLFESTTEDRTSIANLVYSLLITSQSLATVSKQTIGNNSLSSIDTKLSSQATATNQTTGNSSLSTIESNTGSQRTPTLISTTTTGTIAPQIHNVSFYNAGSAAGTVTVSGGSAISIPAGLSVNFNAGGNNNRYAVNSFSYNATGTTFIIGYTQ